MHTFNGTAQLIHGQLPLTDEQDDQGVHPPFPKGVLPIHWLESSSGSILSSTQIVDSQASRAAAGLSMFTHEHVDACIECKLYLCVHYRENALKI